MQAQPTPQQLQPQATGAGFGGYGPQSYGFQNTLSAIPQAGVATFPQQQPIANGIQPQTTNPFRASMLVTNQTGAAGGYNQPGQITQPLTRQNTNPFAKRLSALPPSNPPLLLQCPHSNQPSLPYSHYNHNAQEPIHSQSNLHPLNPTLSSRPSNLFNPIPREVRTLFRQSAFINQQTGQGWHVGGTTGYNGWSRTDGDSTRIPSTWNGIIV